MERFKNINYIQWLAILLGLRALYDFSLSQALVVVALLAFDSFAKWMENKKEEKINNDLNSLEQKIQDVEVIKQELTELRTNLSGIMIKNASKPDQMKRELDGRRFF